MTLPEPEAVVAMTAGPEMDAIVHELVFKQPRRAKTPKYSSDLSKAVEIIMYLPLYVGRMLPDHLAFKPERPYYAGAEGVLLVSADTPAKALCKAALLYLREKPFTVEATSDEAPADRQS